MLKIAITLSLLCFVCADPPKPQTPAKVERPKQFRYVEEEDEPHHYPSAQKQEAEQHQYGSPNNQDNHHDQYLAHNKPEILIHQDYGNNAKQVEHRPLVTVNKEDTGLGRNVGVGVNVGRAFQMDLKRENNLGSKAVNLGLNVLNGLVKVNVQRDRDPFSGKRGPILVQVGGHTIYSN